MIYKAPDTYMLSWRNSRSTMKWCKRGIKYPQVIQSDLRILPETIESDVGLLRDPISSGEHRSDLTGFSSDSFRSDSGPEYIRKDPIETSRKQLKDPLTLTKIRQSENRGKHKIRRHSIGFQQTLISDFGLQQPE